MNGRDRDQWRAEQVIRLLAPKIAAEFDAVRLAQACRLGRPRNEIPADIRDVLDIVDAVVRAVATVEYSK
jgi:hypothetical protein